MMEQCRFEHKYSFSNDDCYETLGHDVCVFQNIEIICMHDLVTDIISATSGSKLLFRSVKTQILEIV